MPPPHMSVKSQRHAMLRLLQRAAAMAGEYRELLTTAQAAVEEDDDATLASDLEQLSYSYFAMGADVRDLLCAHRGHD